SNVSINQAIITFFEFLGNDDSVTVYFSEAIGSKTDNVPYIADPTNNENNTINMSGEEWKEVIDMAETAFETLSYAKNVQESGKTLELWKEIFGPSFNIQEKV
ncbi:MAG: nucleotidyltransferase, partial [Oligoflexia bacterium]|nr:nucleotidyltransferase [Oligoflexia bacterium]